MIGKRIKYRYTDYEKREAVILDKILVGSVISGSKYSSSSITRYLIEVEYPDFRENNIDTISPSQIVSILKPKN